MMRINVWFDFTEANLLMIQRLDEVLASFTNHHLIEVFYRSYPQGHQTHAFHALYQMGRKKGFKNSFIFDLFTCYLNGLSSDETILTLKSGYPIDEEAMIDETYLKIVYNQMEHGRLHKIKETPSMSLSHGFRVTGKISADHLKAVLIQMYEKELGIEYCEEDDCQR
jgi:hypothetical protein